jgi:hypothetical protein
MTVGFREVSVPVKNAGCGLRADILRSGVWVHPAAATADVATDGG